jgi:choline dehydrogenase
MLMQSGIADEAELQRLGVPVVQALPGVGRNLHDHIAFRAHSRNDVLSLLSID